MSARAVAVLSLMVWLGCKAREPEPHVVQPAAEVAVKEATPEKESESGHGLGLGLAKNESAKDKGVDQPRVPTQAKPTAPRTAASPRRASPAAAPTPDPSPTVDAPPPPEPAPAAPAAKPATRVSVPNTDHVHVEVPAGLQAWLDKDARMQPWLGKVMKVIDDCYANVRSSAPTATGTITFRVTMHENARPDPEIESLPGALSSVVACATGQLMRTRMPLFTGTEGEHYVVRVRFE